MFTVMERQNEKLVKSMMKFLKTDQQEEIVVQKVKYALQVIVSEVEKLIILLMIFGIVGKTLEFLTAYVAVVTIRIYVGGNHVKTFLGCVLYTFIMYAFILTGADYFIPNRYICGGVEILIMISIWNNQKSLPESRILYSQNRLLEFKMKALSVLILQMIITQYLPESYRAVIMWGFIIQTIDVQTAIIQRRKRKDGCKKNE